MKLIITGSRTFTDYQLLCQTLAPERHRITEVIHGGARGADQLGFRWALKHHIRLLPISQLDLPEGICYTRSPQAWPRLAGCRGETAV